MRLMSAFTVAIVAAASTAFGQTAPPTLEKVSPTGAQRGTRATVTIQGTNIGGATRIIFSEPGFSANIAAIKEIPIEKPEMAKGVVRTDAPIDDKAKKYEVTAVVTIAADVPHGVHVFRLHTPLGVSNLLRFAVSSLPEVADQEPNEPDAPQHVKLPAGISGALGKAGDVDAYQFQARAGDEMVFQLVARPLGSRLDSVLRLTGRAGRGDRREQRRRSEPRFGPDVALRRRRNLRRHDRGCRTRRRQDRLCLLAVCRRAARLGRAFPLDAPPGPAMTRKVAELRTLPRGAREGAE